MPQSDWSQTPWQPFKGGTKGWTPPPLLSTTPAWHTLLPQGVPCPPPPCQPQGSPCCSDTKPQAAPWHRLWRLIPPHSDTLRERSALAHSRAAWLVYGLSSCTSGLDSRAVVENSRSICRLLLKPLVGLWPYLNGPVFICVEFWMNC
jgi:hypothetical protein